MLSPFFAAELWLEHLIHLYSMYYDSVSLSTSVHHKNVANIISVIYVWLL